MNILFEEGSNAPFFSCSNIHHIIIISVSKFKQSIRTAQSDLHTKICLETKFYIFWKFFTNFLDRYKITVFGRSRNSGFVPILKHSKKFPKNIKFGLQAHFNMEIMLNGSDRLFELWKFLIWRSWKIYKKILVSIEESLTYN